MKKLLLAAAILLLAGCARHPVPVPMPVDVNPSEALKFARAMNLRNINDEGDNYYIYNKLTRDKAILTKERTFLYNAYPLDEPVHKDKNGTFRTAGGDLIGSAILGAFLGSGFGLTDFMISSGNRRRVPYYDGMVMIGSWNNLDSQENRKEINDAITKKSGIIKQQDPDLSGCVDDSKKIGPFILPFQPDKDQKDTVSLDPATLPRPPGQTAGTTKILAFFGSCFDFWAQKASSLEVIKDISSTLGADRAIFIPGSVEHEPVVFHNGEALYFRH